MPAGRHADSGHTEANNLKETLVKILPASFVIILVCILSGAGSSANAQGVSKCFRADWLQGERVVNFRIDGGKVTGTFVVGSGGDTPPDATYEFTGTLKGD